MILSEIDKLRRAFRNHIKEYYGDRAIVRRSKNEIVARAADNSWRATITVGELELHIILRPLDETLHIQHSNPNEFDLLDDALGRCAAPLTRWTASAVQKLVWTTFANSAHILSGGANIDIIYPKDSSYDMVVVECDKTGVEIKHGKQNIRDRIRQIVDLDGDFEEVRARILEAIQPRLRRK